MVIKQLAGVFLALLLISCGKPKEHHYQGYVEGENLYLASPYSGVLIKRPVYRGQWVKRGALIFKLDDNPEALMIAQSEASLLQAKKTYADMIKPKRPAEIAAIKAQIAQTDAELRLAEIRVKRMTFLYAKNATDKDDVDAAESHYEEVLHTKEQYQANLELALQGTREEQQNAQQAQINNLIAKLNQSRWELAQKSVFAPADGIIFDTYFRVGEFVGSQQAVASLLTPNNIRIEFYVPLAALNELKIGEKVFFTCNGCNERNEAVINYISPKAEYAPPLIYSNENNDKLTFRVKAAIVNNPTQFKPGQPVIVITERSNER